MLIKKTKKLIARLGRIFNKHIRTEFKNQLYDMQAQQFLNILCPTDIFIPITDRSMRPVLLQHILNDIIINNRTCILEFGSGSSTIMICRLIKTHNLDLKFVSIDSNKDWITILNKQLANENLAHYVDILYAPVDNLESSNRKWYSGQELEKLTDYKFDLVIVDGPVGNICKNAREPAIPLVQNNLSDTFTIFLDDVHRTDESEILDSWARELNLLPNKTDTYGWISTTSNFSSAPISQAYEIIATYIERK
ncbi:Methyltransferase domain-containing protein [Reichenbachiella faecimaris]|uniref:Methyltransferase domain-containing protein n=1 Tax=Reichenbachiella faecimaris TaxID=692418 RepID=A0A1W2GJ36_REIFA|nr:class I SAM-dependent methyltransferase [Reichenbachiella faecimaris]SMD36492.1 Methyltransferase domain-containing protein [Reichenbachiella faecimaris]